MTGKIAARLAELSIELPKPAAPAANYVPFRVSGDTVYISGQIPILDGALPYIGILGDGCPEDQGIAAARLCAINIVAQLREACGGDLDRVRQCHRLGGFVRSTPDFTRHPEIINGASDLMVELFGPSIGAHARAAVGVASLPRGVAVEVDAIFAIAN